MVAQHPEIYIFGPWGGTDGFFPDTFLGGLGQWPQAFCHRESGWQTNFKGLATYNMPKIDVLISGTFHSLPVCREQLPDRASQSLQGQAILLFARDQPWTAARGRQPASSSSTSSSPARCTAIASTALDLRFGKNLRYGNTKTLVALDIFNLTNSNTTDVYQTAYSPTLLSPGRRI